MNKYEAIVLVNPNVEEDGLTKLQKTYTDLINKNGNVTEFTNLGKKELAYEVRKQASATYLQITFEADPTLISELERNFRITDEIIKFMVIKKEN